VLGAKDEREAAAVEALSHELVEARLEDGDVAPVEPLDLLGHHVGADHGVAEVRQVGARGEPHVPRSDDGDRAHVRRCSISS
jgi:hypothetical protein